MRPGIAEVGERLWAASGALAIVLFGCGLLFGDILGSDNYPALDARFEEVRRYSLDNRSEVHALAFLHTLSALALLCFATSWGSKLCQTARFGDLQRDRVNARWGAKIQFRL